MPAYLLDTNVLIRYAYRHAAEHPLVSRAVDTIQQRHDPVVVTAQNFVEFWSVVTRPFHANGFDWTVELAQAEVARLSALFSLLEDDPIIFVRWQRLVRAHRVIGRQVHDARLAAVMLSYGVTHLLTLNVADFTRYPGITPVHPRDV